eukprot:CAMPEP_0113935056 /NCGR_PEP_ID=MMETSP1339-20121228/2274_1 /TAXON_ID=94617 /ORGANISM="Fibrocapsa japonica" /LENGTH=385 /DNA_ID=CAMNT_0000937069 /DNA_START=80 /DNA_END=1237 /DNA_ORIENTATION=- /assembly_acc=CAM_ASM_000762
MPEMARFRPSSSVAVLALMVTFMGTSAFQHPALIKNGYLRYIPTVQEPEGALTRFSVIGGCDGLGTWSAPSHLRSSTNENGLEDPKSALVGAVAGALVLLHLGAGPAQAENELALAGPSMSPPPRVNFYQPKQGAKEIDADEMARQLAEGELFLESMDPFVLPFKQEVDAGKVTGVGKSDLAEAKIKIQALQPYVDEVENYIYEERWPLMGGFLGVFSEQEDQFVNLIDGLFPSNSPLDTISRESMQYEAQRMFLALDELREAAKLKQVRISRDAYSKLAKSYFRFLEAAALVPKVDLAQLATSTNLNDSEMEMEAEEKYEERKQSTLERPEPRDEVLLVSGPDKGRLGKLVAIEINGKAVVKLDITKEVIEVPLESVVKQVLVQ